MALLKLCMLMIQKLFRNINSTTDGDCLQESLSNLNTWSHDNNIKFNALKCKVLSVTRKKYPVTYNYHLGSSSLLRVRKEKDLGVIVTDNLSWNSHIQMITAKANKMLGLLKRICPLLTETKIRRSLYLSHSKLCYGTDLVSIQCLPQSQDRKNTTTRDKMDPKIKNS